MEQWGSASFTFSEVKLTEQGTHQVAVKRVDSQMQFLPEQGLAWGPPSVFPQDGSIWYTHPLRRSLIHWSPREGRVGSWVIDQKLPGGKGPLGWQASAHVLQLAVDDRRESVHFAFFKPKDAGCWHAELDLTSGKWEEQRIGLGWPLGLVLKQGAVHIAVGGRDRVFIYSRTARGNWNRWEGPTVKRAPGAMQTCFLAGEDGALHLVWEEDLGIRHCWTESGMYQCEWVIEARPQLWGSGQYIFLCSLYPSATVSSQGSVHVLYYEPSKKSLVLLTKTPVGWRSEPVAAAEGVYWTDMCLAGDWLVTAFVERPSRQVRICWKNFSR